jgi:hypothetical protein
MTRNRLVIAGLVACVPAAHADSIDGAWCKAQGQRMVIQGANILTPAGSRALGDYGRHSFNYVVPASDPSAGTIIRMVLMGEDHVQVQEGAARPVIWNRCGPATS